MRGLLVIVASLAVASCSPTLNLLTGALGGILGGGGGGGGANPAGAVLGTAQGILGGAGGARGIGGAANPVGSPLGAAKGILGGAGGLGGHADKGYQGKGGVYPVGGGGILQALQFLAAGLSDHVASIGSILDDVIHLRIPGLIDDGFNAISGVGRGLGGIINAVIPGLGSLLGNVVVSIAKIATCALGSPGLTGAIIGDRRPGLDNPVDIPAICRKDWGQKYGFNYNGDYSNPGNVISHYKVQNAKQQALKLINRYTHGRGLNGLTVQERVVCESIINIASIIDKNPSTWTKEDYKNVALNFVIIVSALGESYQSGLGEKLAVEMLTFLKKNNKNKKFPDLTPYRSEIFRAIKNIKQYRWNGSFKDTKDNNNSRSNNSENDTSNDSDAQSSIDSRSDRNSDSNNRDDSNNDSNNRDDSNDSNNDSNNRDDSNNDSSNRNDNNNDSNNNDDSNNDSSIKNDRNNDSNNRNDSNNDSNNRNDSNNDSNNRNDSNNDSNNRNDSNNDSNNRNDSNNDSNNRNDSNNDSNNSDDSNNGNSSGHTNDSDSYGSDGSGSSVNGGRVTDFRKRAASNNDARNTDESSQNKSSEGSGRRVKNANGSSEDSYNFKNYESNANKKTSQNTDARSLEESYQTEDC